MMRWHLSIRAGRGALRRIQRFILAFAKAHGLGRTEAARIAILTEELLTNLVKYGHRHRSRARHLTLALRLQERRVAIDFSDDGPRFDPLARPKIEVAMPADERPLGQFGLHILQAYADEARYRRIGGRNMLRLVRRIGPYRAGKQMPRRARWRPRQKT